MRPAALLALLALAGCSGPADPVAAALAGLEGAVEARDADAVGACLAPDFAGPGGMTRQAALDTVRRLLLGYEQASVEVYEVLSEPLDSGARVSFWVEFSGRARRLGGLDGLLPPGAVYSFDLELRRSDPRWLVVEASWQRRAGPGTPDAGVSSSSQEGAR